MNKYEETIFTLIKKTYPDESIDICNRKEYENFTLLINDIILFTILPNTIWKDIKKRIDVRLHRVKNKIQDICDICEENKNRVSCTRCYNYTCAECYIKIFTENEGIIKCPYCRYEYGHKLPPLFVQLGVADIKNKLKNKLINYKSS